METDEIDALLQRYSAAEERIGANLLELHDHPTYALITEGALVGATERRLADVAALAPSLWTGLNALGEVLSEARAERADGRMTAERRAALEQLLTGPSVLVAVVETPLAERDLLGEEVVEKRITITELLGRLRDVYEPLRDGVAEIDAVWRDLLPRLDAAATTHAELVAEVAELGVAEPTVSRLARRIDDVRALVMDDPLGLDPDEGPALDAAVSDAARTVGELRHSHDRLHADLARTEVLAAEARTLRARAAVARSEAAAKIADPEGVAGVPDESLVDEIARRGAALRAETGDWQPRRARLDAWLATAERLVAQLRSVESRNRRPLDRRDQLRGLLSAYRAKAAALGLIEEPTIADLVDEAHSELYTAPTDLSRADELLQELADLVRAETGGR